MDIKIAEPSEYEAVRAFYYAVTDAMIGQEYDIGWIKDVYPSQEFLRSSIEGKELFIAVEDDEIVSAMVVNGSSNEGYGKIKWGSGAKEGEYNVIHALCVDPNRSGHGIGKTMVRYAVGYSKGMGKKAVRLDTIEGDKPANHLYESQGFVHQGTVMMYYPDSGWTNYDLFEKLCK